MQVEGLQVSMPWYILAAPPERVALRPGQTLRVIVTFNYKFGGTEPVDVMLHGFIGSRQPDGTFQAVADGTTPIDLAPAGEFTPWEASVDIPTSDGILGIGKTPEGTYDLLVRIDEHPAVYSEVTGSIDITSGAADLTNMLGMIMPLMMLGMIMPMVTGGLGEP